MQFASIVANSPDSNEEEYYGCSDIAIRNSRPLSSLSTPIHHTTKTNGVFTTIVQTTTPENRPPSSRQPALVTESVSRCRAIRDFGVKKSFVKEVKKDYSISRRWTCFSTWLPWALPTTQHLSISAVNRCIDAEKNYKNNTHSYSCIFSNMTNNNWFVCILCYCKSNIDTGKIPS